MARGSGNWIRIAFAVAAGLSAVPSYGLPIFDVAPVIVHVGNAPIGVEVGADVVVTNLSNASQTVSGIGVGGVISPSGSGIWGVGNASVQPCGSAMPPGGTCRIAVTYEPLLPGPSSFVMNLLLTPQGGAPESFTINADGAGIANAASVPALAPPVVGLLAGLIAVIAGLFVRRRRAGA